jgi:hypothetical protein
VPTNSANAAAVANSFRPSVGTQVRGGPTESLPLVVDALEHELDQDIE